MDIGTFLSELLQSLPPAAGQLKHQRSLGTWWMHIWWNFSSQGQLREARMTGLPLAISTIYCKYLHVVRNAYRKLFHKISRCFTITSLFFRHQFVQTMGYNDISFPCEKLQNLRQKNVWFVDVRSIVASYLEAGSTPSWIVMTSVLILHDESDIRCPVSRSNDLYPRWRQTCMYVTIT